MGLDMNFYKKIYLDPMKKGRKYPTARVGKYKKAWCARGESEIAQAKAYKDVKFIVCDAGYLRKANAIHKFIVDNCFDEDDPNCRDIVMSNNVIRELRTRCDYLIKHKDDENFEELAKEKLPTEDGFFFGSREYNEWYLYDLKEFLRFSNEWELDNTNVDYIYHPWY